MFKKSKILLSGDYVPSIKAMHKYGGFWRYAFKCLCQLLSPHNILLDLWSELSFDRRYNVSTAIIIPADKLGYHDKEIQKHAVMHWPSAPYRVNRALKRVKKHINNLDENVFVDYGCGAGRAMIVAAEAGFKHVVGIELSPPLVELCRSNIKRYSAFNKDSELTVVFKDVSTFIPPKNANVFFFYVPFSQEIYDKVVENINLSFKEHPRDMYVLDMGSNYDFLKSDYRLLNTIASVKIYEKSVPIGSSRGDRDEAIHIH